MPAELETPVPAAAEDARLVGVREVFFQLRKSVKTIGMYRHSVHRYGEYLKATYEALQRALRDGPILLTVTASAFQFSGQPVWEQQEGDNLAYRFFSEGIRRLVFRPGITEDELGKLVLVMLSNPERGGEEILAQLWSAGFEHIDHMVVEGFTVGELSEAQVDVEVDRVVDYLRQRLEGAGDDVLSFARVSAADLELKLDAIDQFRGAVLDGEGISEAFKARVQEQLHRDEVERLPRQVTDLMLVQIRDGKVVDPEVAESMLLQVLDALLLSEDFPPIARMIEGLGRIAGSSPTAAAVGARFPARLSEEHRLRRVGDALRHNQTLDLEATRKYLGAVEGTTVPLLLELLDGVEAPNHRALLVEALTRLGRDKPELFLARLASPNSQLVRDMLQVLEGLGSAERWKHIELAVRNPNPAVRQEVVGILASSKGNEAHRYLLDATTDSASAVRTAAFRALVQYNPVRASQDLLRLPKLPDWERRDAREKELIYACLGATHSADSLKHFAAVIQLKKPLLGGKKIIEQKLLAIAGLQSASTLPAYKVLQQAAEAGDQEILSSARAALFAVKKSLQDRAGTASPAAPGSAEAAETSASALYSDFEQASREATAERERIRAAAEKSAREEREGTSVDVGFEDE